MDNLLKRSWQFRKKRNPITFKQAIKNFMTPTCPDCKGRLTVWGTWQWYCEVEKKWILNNPYGEI